MSALFGRLFVKNLQIFRNLWCVCIVKGGSSSADILRTQVKFIHHETLR